MVRGQMRAEKILGEARTIELEHGDAPASDALQRGAGDRGRLDPLGSRAAVSTRTKNIEIARIWAPGIPELLEPEGTLEVGYPPVIVGPSDEDGEHELIDGFHRVAAAKADGRRCIRAIIVSPEELARLETMAEADWIEWIQAAAAEEA